VEQVAVVAPAGLGAVGEALEDGRHGGGGLAAAPPSCTRAARRVSRAAKATRGTAKGAGETAWHESTHGDVLFLRSTRRIRASIHAVLLRPGHRNVQT